MTWQEWWWLWMDGRAAILVDEHGIHYYANGAEVQIEEKPGV